MDEALDEARSAPLHRWLSFCRLLMQFHPRVGAQIYAAHLQGPLAFKPGWNAVHSPPGAAVAVRYVRIGAEEGLTTETKPDVPDAEIHHVHEAEMPAFAGSLARQHMSYLMDPLADRHVPGFLRADLERRLEVIDAASLLPLRGPSPAVQNRSDRELGRLKRAVTMRQGKAAILAPLFAVVEDGLGFELTLTYASNLLADLMAALLLLPASPTPFPERLLGAVDHLIERAGALKEQRQQLRLGRYFEATCLAMLYGNTALLLCRKAAQQLSLDTRTSRLLSRRGLYIDEVMAHDLSPCLMHPADLMPCSPLEMENARTRGISNAAGLYAGAAGQGEGPVDFQALWPRIEAYSAQALDLDLRASIRAENHPLPPEERALIGTFPPRRRR